MSEDKPAAPQDLAEKLRSHRPDDGRPPRRRLKSLVASRGFRVEEETRRGRSVVVLQVSHCPVDLRSWWKHADDLAEPNPWFERIREEPEAPPRGEQWD